MCLLYVDILLFGVAGYGHVELLHIVAYAWDSWAHVVDLTKFGWWD